MSNKFETKATFVATAQKLIAGTAKHLTTATPVAMVGGTFTPAEITTKLQSVVTLRDSVDTAKAATVEAIAAEKTSLPTLLAFARAYESYLKVTFSTSPGTLADFGITPKLRTAPTAATTAAAVVKRASTRVARHTMGSEQKKAVKGDVTGVVITPVSAPAPIVTTPGSPSAPATSGGGQAAAPTPAGSTPSGTAPAPTTVHSTQ